jgi:hypothetical protein
MKFNASLMAWYRDIGCVMHRVTCARAVLVGPPSFLVASRASSLHRYELFQLMTESLCFCTHRVTNRSGDFTWLASPNTIHVQIA